ncbi:hypothetical protein TRVA0_060S00606 [Trichomonascus vanleenenianus]|uniref:uncharacterized protein n=1 Tax=Trichomonascus vanleenenianus TaxID=2268995 RepID=UPI003ECAC7BF
MSVPESPLVRVERGELRPKVLGLYETLFEPDAHSGELGKSDGFWTEFYLLRCNQTALYKLLSSMSAEELLGKKKVTRQLFAKAVEHLETARAQEDLATVDNVLLILTIFFQCIFTKTGFVSYSSDIIDLLAGLEAIDKVFPRLLRTLNELILRGHTIPTRVTAIRTTTIAAGGAFQTSLSTYFAHKDMFGSIMDFIHTPGTDSYVGDAFSLLGILASFDKFEAYNPYRTRLADFVDDATMMRIVQASGHVWTICRNQYLSPSNSSSVAPSPASSSHSIGASLVSWMRFKGGDADQPHSYDEEEDRNLSLNPTISLLQAVYEFVYLNRVFCRMFLQIECPQTSSTSTANGTPFTGGSSEEKKPQSHPTPAIATFLSFCTFLLQNQGQPNDRTATYSRLCLLVLRVFVEDQSTVSSLLVDEHHKTKEILVCHQRNPALPKVTRPRVLMEGLIDALQCALRYNTKRTMDYDMYELALTTTFQAIAYLRQSKSRVEYHWHELWRTLISVLKFMTSHPPKANDKNPDKCAELICIILATCLIHGDTLLPQADQYDDLFYKLMTAADDLDKARKVYPRLQSSPAMAVLLAAINHYKALIEKQSAGNRVLTAKQVADIIKQGYQTLSLNQVVNSPAGDNNEASAWLLSDAMPKYRESDERLFFKRATRHVIHDMQKLYAFNSTV